MVIRRFLACKSLMYMFAAARRRPHSRVHSESLLRSSGTHSRNAGWLQTFIATLRTENRIGRLRSSLMCHKQSMPFIASSAAAAAAFCPRNACGGRAAELSRDKPRLTRRRQFDWYRALDAVDRFGALCPRPQTNVSVPGWILNAEEDLVACAHFLRAYKSNSRLERKL